MTARLVPLLLLLLGAVPARAGVIIVEREHGGDSTVFLDARKVRFDEPKERGQITIFDGDAHRLLHLDTKAHTYYETTEADAKALRSKLDAGLASLPPERRQRFEALLKQRMEAPPRHEVRYVALGSHENVAGFGCDGYRKMRDGKPRQEGCYIPWSPKAVAKADLAGTKELAEFLRKLFANAFGAHASGPEVNPLLEEIEAAPGFPAVLDDLAGGSRRNVSRLVSIEHTRLSPDTFAVPTGYRKVQNPVTSRAR